MTEIEVDSEYEVAPVPDVNVDRYIDMVSDNLRTASQPVIITGHEINSFHLHKALEQFVNQTHIPVAQLSLGKGRLTKRTHIILAFMMAKLQKTKLKIMSITVMPF